MIIGLDLIKKNCYNTPINKKYENIFQISFFQSFEKNKFAGAHGASMTQ
jgi:hypothetical protein